MKVSVIRNQNSKDVSDKIGDLNWSESLDQLGTEFSFEMGNGDLKLGDIIRFVGATGEILRGIITETPINSSGYTGYDYAFYLNKSEIVIQFNKVAADKAIKQLCSRYSVPIGTVAKMPTLIKKVYKDVVVSDVIADILKQVKAETGKAYRAEMAAGKLCVIEPGLKKIKPTYRDELGRVVRCSKSVSITGRRSIEELRNKIVVAGTGENKTDIRATAISSTSIKKYGLLSEVETAEDLTNAKAKNIAKTRLKELNRVAVSFTAEMVGDERAKPGRQIYFNIPEEGIDGWYKIRSASHSVSGGIYTMSLEMERN